MCIVNKFLVYKIIYYSQLNNYLFFYAVGHLHICNIGTCSFIKKGQPINLIGISPRSRVNRYLEFSPTKILLY